MTTNHPTEPNAQQARRWAARGVGLALLAATCGVISGASSFVFLETLDAATDVRRSHEWLLYLLPAAGLVIGATYHYLGGRSGGGTAMVIAELDHQSEPLPRQLSPLVYLGTLTSHLFGASVGREGTAVQMAAGLCDPIATRMRLDARDRRILLTTAIAGGFGSVFGVPIAGAAFAIEVRRDRSKRIRGFRFDALAPALVASFVGDAVVNRIGHHHTPRPQLTAGLDVALFAKVAVAALAFAAAAWAFVALTSVVRRVASLVAWAPTRPVLGGVATVALALVFGHEYLGLSLPILDDAFGVTAPSPAVFALKLLFTAVALGSGFPGGEVTPMFVIGATLGAALASPLGLSPALLAAVGFVAVFAAAGRIPLACTILGVEVFGMGALVPLALGCLVATLAGPRVGIYHHSAARAPKSLAGQGPNVASSGPPP